MAVAVGSSVGVAVGCGVWVGRGLRTGLGVGGSVGVALGGAVGVAVGIGVFVGLGVCVGDGVCVGFGVPRGVGSTVPRGLGVECGVAVAAGVGVAVGTLLGVAVGSRDGADDGDSGEPLGPATTTVGDGDPATAGRLDDGPADAPLDGSAVDPEGTFDAAAAEDPGLPAATAEGSGTALADGGDAWATPRPTGVAKSPADRATVARMRLRTPIATTRRARCAAVTA